MSPTAWLLLHKGVDWLKSQTAVSVCFPLCNLHPRIKNISLKRGSLFAFGTTENWATPVNGDKAEKQKECHLPDELCCVAVRHQHKHHTATLSVCPCASLANTPSATALANKSWKWHRQGPETVHDTIPGLNLLCFSECAGLGVRRYLFAQSFQDVLACSTRAFAALATGANNDGPPETRQRYCSRRHSKTERQSIKGVREGRRVQRVLCAVTVHGRKCDSALRGEKKDKPIQSEDGRGKAGKAS